MTHGVIENVTRCNIRRQSQAQLLECTKTAIFFAFLRDEWSSIAKSSKISKQIKVSRALIQQCQAQSNVERGHTT